MLEDWGLLGLQLGHRLPIIQDINLNRRAQSLGTRLFHHVGFGCQLASR